jgi:AcrR family transcriptional regulator
VIAERAGVAEGTIYRHFTSKEQLLNEIYRAGVRLFTTALRDTSSGLPCRERLELIAKGWRDIAARNAPVVRLVFVTELRGLLDARSRDALKELREEIEKVIASGKGAGQVRPGAVEVWADVWLELIRLILQRVADKEWAPDHSAPQHVIDSAWVAIATPGAIAAPSPPPPPSATSPPGPAVSG